jgi:leader peptidase (prepilin peptidase)/N-methyltransferase
MTAVAVVCGVLGLAAGAFLNVLIDRVPRHEHWLKPAPYCESCATTFAWWENSALLLLARSGGRCRVCGERVPVRAAVIELATAVLFVSVALRFGASWVVPGYCLFFAALLVVSVVDLDHYIVPNRIIYPTLLATVPLLGGAALLEHRGQPLEHAAVGGVAGFLVFGVIHFISPRGMGFGDVRLAGVIGAYLGWLGYRFIAVAFFLAFLTASVVGIGLMITRIRGRKDAVPFAPFMAVGAVAAVLWGQHLVSLWGSGRA